MRTHSICAPYSNGLISTDGTLIREYNARTSSYNYVFHWRQSINVVFENEVVSHLEFQYMHKI